MDEFNERGRMGDYQERLEAPVKAAAQPAILWVETYSKGVREIGEEVGRFVSGHTQRNIDAWIALTQNPTPAKIVETHQRWLAETMREYTDEGKRLMEISSGIMQEFMTRMQHPTTRE